ncbi:hypothetical protein FB451DRAFT_1176969 [Mycena latifolia]|nr:hypothetical protein FB451DRAFT_1176969 [Mycena latifolia]
MDSHYDHEKASEHRLLPLATFTDRILATMIDSWTESMKEMTKDMKTIKPAAFLDDNKGGLTMRAVDGGAKKFMVRVDSGRAEVILSVVGILKSFDLPPVKKNSISASRVPYARAYAEVVGYKSKHFANAVSTIEGLMYDLATSFAEDSVVHWIPEAQSELFGPTLSSGCRYFTTGSEIEHDTRINFARFVDPASTLGAFIGERVAHCEGNHVAYLGVKKDKFIKKDPASFRIGDVVEMGFAITAFRQAIRGEPDKHVCKPVLRTLTLLDATLSKDAFKARVAASLTSKITAKPKAQPKIPLIRNRAFVELSSDEEDASDARAEMASKRIADLEDDMEMEPSDQT